MVVAEFLFIAIVVGMATKTWLGFLGTFVALYALYRFTRLSALLSLTLSLCWGYLGYQLGAASGEFLVGPLAALVGFVFGVGIHHDGLLPLLSRRVRTETAATAGVERAPEVVPASQPPGRRGTWDDGEIIDVEYRVVS